jgi:hypothetical protein
MSSRRVKLRMVKTPARADVLELLAATRAEAKEVGAKAVAVVFVTRDGSLSFRWTGVEEVSLLGGLKIVADKLSRELCP